jgi:pyruvate kinase
MSLYWGVRPVRSAQETSTDKIIDHAVQVVTNKGYVEEGDTVIVTAGVAGGTKKGMTNMMRVVNL